MINISTRIISTGGPDVSRRHLSPATKDANFETIRAWHRLFVPEHFQTTANARYGYKARKGDNEPPELPRTDSKGRTRMVRNRAYTWRKRRQKGHNRPLVWSGASERLARAMIRVSGTSKQARGVLALLPRYFYQYRLDQGNRIDKADELLRTTPREIDVLVHIHRDTVTGRLESVRERVEITAA
jgi:hypothetical protein